MTSQDMNRSRVLRRASKAQAKRRERRNALALSLAAVLAVSGLGAATGAAMVKADAQRGLTVSDSLCTAGIGCAPAERAMIRARLRGEAPAIPARLIGECGGRIMAAMEESSFPAGCTWIEPIRYQESS